MIQITCSFGIHSDEVATTFIIFSCSSIETSNHNSSKHMPGEGKGGKLYKPRNINALRKWIYFDVLSILPCEDGELPLHSILANGLLSFDPFLLLRISWLHNHNALFHRLHSMVKKLLNARLPFSIPQKAILHELTNKCKIYNFQTSNKFWAKERVKCILQLMHNFVVRWTKCSISKIQLVFYLHIRPSWG